MSPYLHQQGPGGQVLIIPAVAQHNGPGQGDIVGNQLLLIADGQRQVVNPVGVGGSAAVRAHYQHHLCHLLPVFLADQFINGAIGTHQGIPVHVQNNFDAGVFGQPILHRRTGAVIRPVIGGIVVQIGVVNHFKPIFPENLGHLLPYPHHIAGAVGGPVGVALLVGKAIGLGISFTAVGM